MNVQVQERPGFRVDGFLALAIEIAAFAGAAWLFVDAVRALESSDAAAPPFTFWAALILLTLSGIATRGFFTVQPNDASVLLFLGRYVGSVRDAGFWWTNPFTSRTRVSMRVRNFNSEKAKVNDREGNPIEIACVVVWEVTDSAKALFAVDAYERFVALQAETAIRGIATRHPYDAHETGVVSLRGNPDDVAAEIQRELEHRLEVSGVAVKDARISHLAYAPEIAQAMLRRQQAQAVVAARQQIVEGAVGMVELALNRLSERSVIELDEERKANMVSNLLVVLVGEGDAQPVINAGTLY